MLKKEERGELCLQLYFFQDKTPLTLHPLAIEREKKKERKEI